VRVCVVVVCFTAVAVTASMAQGRGGPGGGGPPPGGGGGMGGGMNGGGPPPPGGRGLGDTGPPGGPPPAGHGGQPNEGQMRPALQLGPPGRWWDDKSFAKSLKLRPDQQTRMDAIFDRNRDALVFRYQGLQQAESQMEEISRSSTVDEPTLFTQIDRVAQARAELEKANAHMLLQIRKEMDADQIARLEKHR
jgi:Spy/CpxP family protein refolding chaperone